VTYRYRDGARKIAPFALAAGAFAAPALALVAFLAPSLLAALVVTQVVGGDRELVFDARLVGLGAAAIAILARAPLILVIVIAAAASAAVRALS
jgi:hypothetical protein